MRIIVSERLLRNIALVATGVGLGFLGRWVFGIKAADSSMRHFRQPINYQRVEQELRESEVLLEDIYQENSETN